jgi:serpin B
VGLHTVDLQGDSERSRAAINDWAAEQTRDRIPELLPEGFVNARSVYVLVNTIYLKANWQQIFGKYPTDGAVRDATRRDVRPPTSDGRRRRIPPRGR